MTLQTEVTFELPRGFVDDNGVLHRSGTMRMATARDELEPLRDPRFDGDEAVLTILILSRVITGLGSLERVEPEGVLGLFAADLAYLQDLYDALNFGTADHVRAVLADPLGLGGNATGREGTTRAANGVRPRSAAGKAPGKKTAATASTKPRTKPAATASTKPRKQTAEKSMSATPPAPATKAAARTTAISKAAASGAAAEPAPPRKQTAKKSAARRAPANGTRRRPAARPTT